MTNFFLTLPSNASLNHFPENTLAHYHNKLPEALDLTKPDWEVGLVEMTCPNDWPNISREEVHEAYVNVRFIKGAKEKVTLPAGYYPTPRVLVDQLNSMIQAQVENPRLRNSVGFEFNDIQQKASLKLKPGVKVSLGGKISRMLGFAPGDKPNKRKNKNGDEKANSEEEEKIPADRYPDIHDGIHNIFVYSNVVRARQVGDRMVPLLRILPTSKNDGYHSLDNVHYVPTCRRVLDSVEIDIRTPNGQSFPFEVGQVIVTLHFRQK